MQKAFQRLFAFLSTPTHRFTRTAQVKENARRQVRGRGEVTMYNVPRMPTQRLQPGHASCLFLIDMLQSQGPLSCRAGRKSFSMQTALNCPFCFYAHTSMADGLIEQRIGALPVHDDT